jgi:hypothetical protein
MADKRPRFTRITGQLSGVQQDEADLGDPEPVESVRDWFPRFGMPRLDFGVAGTYDPLSDPLDDPFPEELR